MCNTKRIIDAYGVQLVLQAGEMMQLSARPLRRVMACIGRGGARLARNENGAFDWLVSGTEWQAGADVLANVD